MPAEIRPARPRDLERLQGIEDAADALLVGLLRPAAWSAAPTAQERESVAGFVLVAAAHADGDAVGFVHVIESDGIAHLEQLSVLPEFGRSGLGRALVEAAKSEARRRGHAQITLRTFADVPWNAPFYATCGFTQTAPDTPFHRALVRVEADLGLAGYGRRIQMSASTDGPRASDGFSEPTGS